MVNNKSKTFQKRSNLHMEMTLSSILDITTSNYPDREAFIFKDTRATYSELNTIVNRRANTLLNLGVNKGDHVATSGDAICGTFSSNILLLFLCLGGSVGK